MNLFLNPGLASTALRPLVLALGCALCGSVWAADAAADHGPAHPVPATSSPATAASQASQNTTAKKPPVDALPTASGNPIAEKIRAAMAGTVVASKKMTVTVEDKGAKPAATPSAHGATAGHSTSATAKTLASQRYNQARAAAVAGHGGGGSAIKPHDAHAGEAHWAYEGDTGPQAWGKLKPDFNLCAIGKRQSPINIEDGNTLRGPAEPVQFAYQPSNASVVNNGHTIQVDVQGENSITVRGSNYRLLQFHFHTPSEEQLNFKRFPMVAHLVHKNNEGQLAVVAVLLDEGASNPMIDKVWTYMPLDSGDRVRMPQGLLNVTELLPTDQRYYQFMGSLTTPPCSEGVLWMVLKQPVTISKEQYKLFTQLYPNNARPVQPVNGRPVREAQ